jgi:hypothetical protein
MDRTLNAMASTVYGDSVRTQAHEQRLQNPRKL